MRKNILIAIIAAIVILAGVGYWRFTGRAVEVGSYDDFAKCLTEKGVTMYGTSWCSHCQNQKKMFGDSFKYVNYVECSNPDGTQTDACKNAGISGYPTWIINGKVYTGEKTIQELSSLSGCSVG